MMRQKINYIMTTAAVIIASAVCFFSSCDNNFVYDSYQTLDEKHWEKADGLEFVIVPSRYSGPGTEYVMLRLNDKYPYNNLSLYVETCVAGVKSLQKVNFDVTGNNSSGIRHNDYTAPVGRIDVSDGDTIRVRVSHNMKKYALEGITDIGIKISKNN